MCIRVIDMNMPLSQHICTTCCIGFQLDSVSHIGYWCWSGGVFSVVPGHTYVSSVVRYLMYPTIEPFILLLLCSTSWLRLIHIEVAGLVDFLKGRFTNSLMNE